MKTGLILEGGAMRGMFTAGVMDVMMEAGITFDGVVGVSAGAAFGCNYKSGQIGRVIRYNTRFCADRRYSGLGVLIREGNLFSTPFCYEEVPIIHDPFDFDAYESSSMEFYVVCTDVETGKPVYHRYEGRNDHGFDWIRASASMPLVSQIVEIEGQMLLDGGISDSIPVRYFESIGFCRNVVVLTQPKGYSKKKNSLIPLMKMKYRKYPDLVNTMANRHLVYNETLAYIAEQERAGKLLVIRPEQALDIGKAEKNPDRLKAVYELGRNAAMDRLDEIRAYLAQS
jgi:predicted patatin/cPLA2 family phospholipase